MSEPKEIEFTLAKAILAHVPFDGWSEAAFSAAVADVGMDLDAARAACPRGALDLAVAAHRTGDREMVATLELADMGAMR